MKIKIKSHDGEFTDFYDKKISKVDSNHSCLAVISLDSTLRKDDNYYLQVFLIIVNNLSYSFSSEESDEE